MRDILLELLIALEQIGADNEQIYSTDYRESMATYLLDRYLKSTAHRKNVHFDIIDPPCSDNIEAALYAYCVAADQLLLSLGGSTFYDRLAYLQNEEVCTPGEEQYYDDFLGSIDPSFYDADGNVINT